MAPTFRELLLGSGVNFVRACVSDVNLNAKEVSVTGAISDDLEGFMISDNADESELVGAADRACFFFFFFFGTGSRSGLLSLFIHFAHT